MIDAKKFFDGFRAKFGSLSPPQVHGLSFLIASFDTDSMWTDLRHQAYALATIKRETASTYQPIEEYGGRVYLSKYYLNPRLRRALGNIKLSDAWTYKGRGYVQITGRANYRKFNLENGPLKALEPDEAFRIMTLGMFGGLFTGKKITDYINSQITDFVNARKVINGLDHAGEIANDASWFLGILKAAQ
jgi:putative chitinase